MTDTAPENTADRRIRDTVTRRFVRDPLIVGLVLLAAAIAWTLAGDDLSFFPFLLMLLGGFGLAFSFVNATMEMRPARKGVVLQLGVAAVLTALMIFVVEFGGADLLADLPEPARAVILVLQIAAGPAVGWVWLGLLSRITDLFRRRDTATRPAPTPPRLAAGGARRRIACRVPGPRPADARAHARDRRSRPGRGSGGNRTADRARRRRDEHGAAGRDHRDGRRRRASGVPAAQVGSASSDAVMRGGLR
ncbi:hypothetical protein JOF42_002977 [Microbacterium phyllosphaerae]|uniref:Uncharacterized protein n=1 Tax=Microbacterium phyllosphaerae TaxID=124798 RepID=A0ABS4WTE3_9MICO|nr:hypothetical protein [Microbacterium phyllosphaerae]MBP2379482.1 hypothetical protein [Microbacterium phyllosphaerae]